MIVLVLHIELLTVILPATDVRLKAIDILIIFKIIPRALHLIFLTYKYIYIYLYCLLYIKKRMIILVEENLFIGSN